MTVAKQTNRVKVAEGVPVPVEDVVRSRGAVFPGQSVEDGEDGSTGRGRRSERVVGHVKNECGCRRMNACWGDANQ